METETGQAEEPIESVRFGPLLVACDDDVLRPRPWTLMQAEWAAELLGSMPPGDVLELFAGAGHIGLVAVLRTGRRLVQVDADVRACGFARRNARDAGLADRVEVVCTDLDGVAGAFPPSRSFPLVIADPPWVRSGDTDDNPEDPESAIDGGPDGLDVVRDCLEVLGPLLAAPGEVLLQVGGRDHVTAVEAHVRGRPALGLTVVEHRLPEDGSEGAVVRLARAG